MTTLTAPARLAALHRLALLDTPAEAAFDRLTRLAARLLHAPVALVTLVDADRQFFKSCLGLPEPWASRRQTPLSLSVCRHALASGEPLVIEDARCHPLLRDSRAIPELGVVAYLGIPLVSSDGHPLGSFCVIDHQPRAWSADDVETLRDLAGAVMTEIELRAAALNAEEARRQRQALLDSCMEGIYGIGADGRCTYINRAALDLLGYCAEECLGRDMHDLMHSRRPGGSPYPVEECPLYRAFRDGKAADLVEEVLWCKDGSPLPALYSCAPIIEAGQVAGAVVTIVDIRERKRAQEELARLYREERRAHAEVERLAAERTAMLAQLSEGIIVADAQGIITFVNAAAQRMHGSAQLGIPVEALADRFHLFTLDGRPYPPERLPLVRAVRQGETVTGVRRRIRRPGEAELIAAGSAAPIYADNGELIGAVLALRDVTAAAELDRLRREFVASVSHDLQTPLTAIRAALGLLEAGLGDRLPPAERELLATSRFNAERLRVQIDDLLAANQLEAGTLRLERQALDLRAVVRGALTVVHPLFAEKRQTVEVDVPAALPARGDRRRLEHVLVNLLANAHRHTPSGTRVSIDGHVGADEVLLCVRDNGSGIPPAELEAVFRRSHRLDATTGGSGLGLTIARAIAELHGGRLWAEAGQQGGTTFCLALPRAGGDEEGDRG